MTLQICQDLIQASLRHPWADEYKEVRFTLLAISHAAP